MKALLLKDTHSFEMIAPDTPVPGAGEVRVRVLSAGICGSEIHGYHGKHYGRKAPAVMGHEVCGVVDAVGAGVSFPAVGTKVTALPQRTCGHCRWCRAGAPNLCADRLMLGFTKWSGAYAEYFIIPAELLFTLPENLSPQVGTLIEPLAVGVHVIRRLGVGLGDSVTVFGSGAIGLVTMLAAKAAGASIIVATDLYDYNLAVARKVGATHTHNAKNGPVAELVRSITNGYGADHAVMAADGPGLVDQGIDVLRLRGQLALVASYPAATTLALQVPKLKELSILGSLTYDMQDFAIAVDLASKNEQALKHLITHEFSLEQAAQAFELADRRTEDAIRVVFTL